MNCPICLHEDTINPVLDLIVCNACNHIFKAEPLQDPNIITSNEWKIHLIANPVKLCQDLRDNIHEDQIVHFVFPSMNFYTLDMNPALFYRYEYNHYFNQMSTMLLLERAGLVPIEQINTWSGTVCKTVMKVRKKRIDE